MDHGADQNISWATSAAETLADIKLGETIDALLATAGEASSHLTTLPKFQ